MRAWWLGLITGAALISAACASGSSTPAQQGDQAQTQAQPAPTTTEVAPPEQSQPPADQAAAQTAGQQAAETEPSSVLFLPPTATQTRGGEPIIRQQVDPRSRPSIWTTNWGVALIDWQEIDFVIPRDAIAPIDNPLFISVAEADAIYAPDSPVIQFERNGDVRAYGLDILTWHEIVNDIVGGDPVAVTFCPLCNTAIAFDRRINDQTLRFGTSGGVRMSDLVMWDDVTQSLWQQIGGKALIGDFVGAELDILPASIVSWEQFKTSFPDGLVLSRETGHVRDYGRNPYPGYDSVSQSPFLFRGVLDERLSPFERVITVEFDEGPVAYPFVLLQDARVIHETRDGQPLVVFWTAGVASALDSHSIDDGRDVGATGVFRPMVDGRLLHFRPNPDAPETFIDTETATVWDIFGRAVSGAMQGSRLEPIVHADHFWFAWAAFQPDTEIVVSASQMALR